MDLQNIIPKNGPAIEEVQKYIKKYIDEVIVIKCGGSVLLDQNLFNQFIQDISIINKLGLNSVIIHGGGGNIKKKLEQGHSESKIYNDLKNQYGEWITYDPELNKNTFFLWLLPLFVFILGGWLVFRKTKFTKL